jgi:hypothetical protein
MKRKNIVLATTAIAASLVAGSVSAGSGGNGSSLWEVNGDPVDILQAIPDENCMFLFEVKRNINEVAKELDLSKGDYREKRYASRYRMEIDGATLAAYLPDNIKGMSPKRVENLYKVLGTADVDLVFTKKQAAKAFIQVAGISSLARVVADDDGDYVIEVND